MRRKRNTKIIATLGPASSSKKMVRALFDAGADVFRLNFSHGTHDDQHQRIAVIREIEAEVRRPIAILTDVQGPKLRCGNFDGGSTRLRKGQKFVLDMDEADGDSERVQLPHPELYRALEPGADLLLDDGRIRLKVLEQSRNRLVTRVAVGGRLSNHKGLNVPGVVLPIASLTRKDREDLAFVLDLGIDFVGLSFVQRPKDVADARDVIQGRAAIMTKLEKPRALEHLDDIIRLSDAVMVARGDLGVELPPEDVPIWQKEIIIKCRSAGRPVVVATQMLESMIQAPAPTRAEASDVATAVYDSADAVMLSGETAVGEFPREAVRMMDRIVTRVEHDPLANKMVHATQLQQQATGTDAISFAARQVAETVGAAAIATFTTSGSTTIRASRQRPNVPIICLTPDLRTARRMALSWGVHAVHTRDVTNIAEMVERATGIAVAESFARKGQTLVITAGVPFGTPGRTNMLRLADVE
ncbi:MAG: pyruvate kinase [Acetobacterales bacterium]